MKIYAELTGNRKKRGIKSPCDNNCEGRCIYDCFVLNEKSNAIYYHGAQGVLKTLDVLTAPGATGKTKVIVTPATEGTNTWVYKTGTAPTAVTYGTALTGWTALSASGVEITPTSTDTLIQVCEVDAGNKPTGLGQAVINLG